MTRSTGSGEGTAIKVVRRPRPERRQLENPNPEARQRLLDAAAALIEEQGVAGLRIDAVAKRAGLSVGTFYLYFEGKADVFVELVLERTERLRERLRAARSGEGTVAERLDRGLIAYLDFVEESEHAFLHFLDAGLVETTVGRLSTWAIDQHVADLQPLLVEAMEAGEIRRHDPVLLAQSMAAMVQHLGGYWLEHKDELSRDDLLAFLRRFLTFGLMP